MRTAKIHTTSKSKNERAECLVIVDTKIESAIKKINDCLSGTQSVDSLIQDIPFFQKALECYDSDIKKAQNTGYEYFVNLVGDLSIVKEDINIIKNAQDKINQFLN